MLTKLPNMFEEINCVHCFNHTLQLSAKTLLKPFNVTLADGRNNHAEDNVLDLEEVNNEGSVEDGSEDDDDGDDDCDDDSDPDSALDFGGADDGVNELDMLPSDEREDILEQMSDIHDAVTKVCPFFYLATNLSISSDPSSGICNHPLDDHCAPCMVLNLPKSSAQGPTDPT